MLREKGRVIILDLFLFIIKKYKKTIDEIQLS